jgi:hypothetical protein
MKSLTIGITYMIVVILITQYWWYHIRLPYTPELSQANAFFNDKEWMNPMIIWPYFSLFIISALFALIPKRLRMTKSELTFVYAMIITCLITHMGGGYMYTFDSNWGMQTYFNMPFLLPHWGPTGQHGLIYQAAFVTYGLCPPVEALGAKEVGVSWLMGAGIGHNMLAAPVPWGAWMPVMANWGLFFLGFLGFLTCFGALWKHVFVDVEDLAFPYATGANEIIQLSTDDKVPGLFKNKWLWIGVGIAAICKLYDLAIMAGAVTPPVSVNAGELNLDPRYMAYASGGILFVFGLMPAYTGIGILIPNSVLASFIIGGLIFLYIIPPVMLSAGMVTPPGPSWGNTWSLEMWPTERAWNFGRIANGWVDWYMLAFWGMIALVIWTFFINRREIYEVISTLWKKPSQEMEEEAPLPYKVLWAGTIIFWFLWIFMMINFNVPIQAAILIALAYPVFFIGFARQRGEAGRGWGADWGFEDYQGWGIILMSILLAIGIPKGDLESFAPLGIFMAYFFGSCSRWNMNMPMGTILEAFKVAKLTNTRSRDILIAAGISVVLTLIIAPIFNVLGAYTFGAYSPLGGAAKWGGWSGPYGHNVHHYLSARSWGFEGLRADTNLLSGDPTAQAINLIVAFAFVLGGYILTRVKPELSNWINPVGFVIVWAMHGVTTIFFMWVLAFIIKTITIRYWGAQQYESKVIPLATGLIVGVGLIFSLMMLGSLYGVCVTFGY